MITITPTGDILIDGIKVGEWYDYSVIDFRLRDGNHYLYNTVFHKDEVIPFIKQLLTNGFTPKKFE